MPLTFPAHPLMVVPLKKLLRLPLDGLALFVGAMSPDFSYIFILDRDIFHSGWQAFGLGLPLALLFYYWIGFIMIPVWRSVFESIGWISIDKITTFRKSSFLWVLLSLFLGIGSHLFLDGLTHHNFWPGMYYVPNKMAFAVGDLVFMYENVAWWAVSVVFSFTMWIIASKFWPHTSILRVKRPHAFIVMVAVQFTLFLVWYRIVEPLLDAPSQGRLPRSFSTGVIALFSAMWVLLWLRSKQKKGQYS